MYATIERPISIESIKNKLLAALNKEELTNLKQQYGETQVKLVWNTMTSSEKDRIQTICSIGSIKHQLLTAFNKEQLIALKEEYGELQIKRIWNSLTDSEKERIKALCSETKEPQPQIEEVSKQLDLTNYLEGEDFEDKALQLATILKNAEASLVNKMLSKNYKSLQNERISISIAKNTKSQEYSLMIK